MIIIQLNLLLKWRKIINYRLKISYDGTNYSGWQSQPEMQTIQNSIENSIAKIFPNQKIKIIGSGRTDTGVHANGQIANIKIDTNMEVNQIENAINSNLPSDIFIEKCDLVDDDFHARFSAKKRQYLYYISSSYSPINRLYLWKCKWKLDISKIQECSKFVVGEHDFSLFSKSSSEVRNKKCIIYESKWSFENSKLLYKVTANRFLQHMVRLLVGTMIEVGRGRISINEFKKTLNNEKSKFSAVRAPAHGLFLNKIFYD